MLHRRHVRRRQTGGPEGGKTKRGTGTGTSTSTKRVAMAVRCSPPLAARTPSASPHELTLVETTLESRFVGELPQRRIGDKAYDSDGLDAELGERGIEMIAPNRCNRRKTQDGRPLRRYKRRWKGERLFAWLGNYRRLVVRTERHAPTFLGFVRLGCILILLRYTL